MIPGEQGVMEARRAEAAAQQSLERLQESACNLQGRGVHYEEDSNDPGGVF